MQHLNRCISSNAYRSDWFCLCNISNSRKKNTHKKFILITTQSRDSCFNGLGYSNNEYQQLHQQVSLYREDQS